MIPPQKEERPMLLVERYLDYCEEKISSNPLQGTYRDFLPQTTLNLLAREYAAMFPKTSEWYDFSEGSSFSSFARFFLAMALSLESEFWQAVHARQKNKERSHPFFFLSNDIQRSFRQVLNERSEIWTRYPFLRDIETLFRASIQKSLETQGIFLWDAIQEHAESFASVLFKYLKTSPLLERDDAYRSLSMWAKASPELSPQLKEQLGRGMAHHFVSHFKNTLLFSSEKLGLPLGVAFLSTDEIRELQANQSHEDYKTRQNAVKALATWEASTVLLVRPFLDVIINDLFFNMSKLSSSFEKKAHAEKAIQQELQNLPLDTQKELAVALQAVSLDSKKSLEDRRSAAMILRNAADTLLVVLTVLQPSKANSPENKRFFQSLFDGLKKRVAQKGLDKILNFAEDSAFF